MEKTIIWDIETLINCSTWCFKELSSGKKKEFILFDNDEEWYNLVLFLRQLKRHDYTLVGFNSINFDAQILERVMKYKYTNIYNAIDMIYTEAQRIVSLKEEERFTNLVPEWKLTHKHIDVFKQKHYDGKAKMGTSLKWIQFSMRYNNIEEMPISHDTYITKDQIDQILSYNWNDVDSTEDFFIKIMFETKLRQTLSEKYTLNLMNASEPRLAKEIFAKFLSEEMKIDKWDLKQLKTPRDLIAVNDIIFPYVSFDTPEFQKLLETFKNTTLTVDSKFERKIDVFGLRTTIGLGGIHSENEPRIVESTDEKVIMSSDVVSYYPNLAIRNNLKPAHLGNAFSKIYESIFEQRKSIPKKDPINYVYKILLNSAYGLSNEKNSFLYDSAFTRSICINGQLLLLMLIEKLKEKIPEIEFIMENTDGLEAVIPRNKEQLYIETCVQWQQLTKLELEHNKYKKMVIMDCNNYISVDENNDVKRKGLFDYNVDYHKNPSFLVIPKALEAQYVDNIDYRDFILNNDDIYDFCAGIKKKKDFELNYYSIEEGKTYIRPQQKVTRYFCSKKGGVLMKDYVDGRQISIESEQIVTIANKIEENYDYISLLDYKYYFKETKKIIDKINKPKTLLLL